MNIKLNLISRKRKILCLGSRELNSAIFGTFHVDISMKKLKLLLTY